MRGICILNAECQGYGGHHFSYALAISKAAGLAGVRSHVFVNRNCDPEVVKALGAAPVFQTPKPFSLGGITVPGIGRYLVSRQTTQALSQIPSEVYSREWAVFVENATQIRAADFRRFICSKPPEQSPVFFLMLRYGCYLPTKNEWNLTADHYKAVFSMLDGLHPGYRFVLVTDSDLLAAQYGKLTNRPVNVLPTINHAQGGKTEPPLAEREANEKICVASPGVAGWTKGSDVLAKAVERLITTRQSDRFHFMLQCYSRYDNTEFVAGILDILEPLAGEDLSLIREPLDEKQYQAILDKADVIVTPYRVDRYQATSGPFAEAVAMGTPIIATENTWMAHEMKKFGIGLGFPEGDEVALADYLVRMADTLEEHRQKSAKAREAWNDFHNPDSYLRSIIELHAVNGSRTEE